MNLMPLLVVVLILTVTSVIVAVVQKLLVDYGECKIIIAQEGKKKEFLIRGGNSLLSYLVENKINISSPCGGKANCGYCKIRVKSGGGQILPTEEIFINKEEKLENMRLSCQVKVKNDIEIFIPDFLVTVKNIVKNRTFDPKLKWSFVRSPQIYPLPEERKIRKKVTTKDRMKLQEIIEEYKDIKGAIVPILQKINNTFNYLPEPVLKNLSEQLNIPLSIIYRIATFYNAFSLRVRGKNIIKVCLGTSCYVKGGKEILQAVENKLGIKVGNATKDLKFSLETVSCIGCCGQSPGMTINDDIYGYLKLNMIDDILKKY